MFNDIFILCWRNPSWASGTILVSAQVYIREHFFRRNSLRASGPTPVGSQCLNSPYYPSSNLITKYLCGRVQTSDVRLINQCITCSVLTTEPKCCIQQQQKKTTRCIKLPLMRGVEGSNHKDLLYTVSPCIFTRGYFQGSNS